MKAKTRFNRMFNALPKKARLELVYDFASNPMNLNVCWAEVKYDTKIGKEILERLGFSEKDDNYTSGEGDSKDPFNSGYPSEKNHDRKNEDD